MFGVHMGDGLYVYSLCGMKWASAVPEAGIKRRDK